MNALTATQPTPTSFRFPWRWVVVGVVAYLVFLLATFPAARLTSKLQTNGILAAGVSGSIWNGSAAAVQTNGITLGATQWHIQMWRLLAGTVSAQIHSKSDEGYLDATVRTGFSGAVTVHELRGSLPVSALSSIGLPGGGTTGWSGTVQLKLDEIAFVNRWPTQIKGTIDAMNLIGPAQQPTQLGGYRITFPVPNSAVVAGEVQGAVLSMDDAPLDVVGTLHLTPNRNYVIDAQVATRPNAPASITKALQYLGPPDAQGRRPLSVAGSL